MKWITTSLYNFAVSLSTFTGGLQDNSCTITLSSGRLCSSVLSSIGATSQMEHQNLSLVSEE